MCSSHTSFTVVVCSSLAMAKAAMEAINGLNMLGYDVRGCVPDVVWPSAAS